MSTLKSTLESLSTEFAAAVLRAIRSASLDELVGDTAPAAKAAPAASSAAAPAPRAKAAKAAKAPAAAPAAAASPAAPKGNRKAPRRRLTRRSPADIQGVVDAIVSLLQRKPEGLRSEDIRAELNLAPNEMPRPLAEGLKSKRLAKEGEKRATVYFAKGAGKKK